MAVVESHPVTEAHPPADPDVAPNHPEVRDTFSPMAIAFCWGVLLTAIILGIVLGLTLTNS